VGALEKKKSIQPEYEGVERERELRKRFGTPSSEDVNHPLSEDTFCTNVHLPT
jgi:hypothetical protein